MKRLVKRTMMLVILGVAVGWGWWTWFRVPAEQVAKEVAADEILKADGQTEADLGDLGDDMKALGVDGDDEAAADAMLDELLAE